jgi:hypothetical protein
MVVPSESKSILSSRLHEFIVIIRSPVGSDDGAEVTPGAPYLLSATCLVFSYIFTSLFGTSQRRYVIRHPEAASK